ncbi:MAG TPA: hypothetical protein G4N93_01940 [Dehalococcoidia bacterium]|nr:hypothetical protein [Dehalococcoidia bacterium]
MKYCQLVDVGATIKKVIKRRVEDNWSIIQGRSGFNHKKMPGGDLPERYP